MKAKLKTRIAPNESSQVVTSGNEPLRIVTRGTDKDKDKEYDLDKDYDYDSDRDLDCEEESDSDIDEDKNLNINKVDALSTTFTTTYNVPQYTFEQIDMIAHAVDEESYGEYPYVTRLVDKFFEINQENNWLGTDGRPIMDIVRWYKQYLDYEMDNGYQLKDVSICED